MFIGTRRVVFVLKNELAFVFVLCQVHWHFEMPSTVLQEIIMVTQTQSKFTYCHLEYAASTRRENTAIGREYVSYSPQSRVKGLLSDRERERGAHTRASFAPFGFHLGLSLSNAALTRGCISLKWSAPLVVALVLV
jgi:hypothetical protein